MDDLIYLNDGNDYYYCDKTPPTISNLEKMMRDLEIEKGTMVSRSFNATDHNIHKGLTVVLGPILQGTNQGGSTVPLSIQPNYLIVCVSNLPECYSWCTVAARWLIVYLWRGFKGARRLPIYPEVTWKIVCAQFCLMRYYSKGYPQGLQGSPTSMTTSCISCVHASPNLQVYALNDRSRGLKTPEHVSRQFFFAKNWRSHRPWKVL